MTSSTAMPSQTQTKSATPRKACKPRRKLTTLSFEQLDRARTTIFTEDISSSSRVRKPSYVLRQGDVVGANMPDTIKLAKHRSKIYVGLSDSSSISSSRRESRGLCRSDATSSAATTIGKASIIDWADAASDVSGNVPLAGELSFLLPPVQGVQSVTSQHTPPGLDTTDIFNYRAVHHKRKGEKSPRQQPPSRGTTRLIAGFRPPQNTPFMTPGRSDDFVATFRKKITPRTTVERCNVVVCGGGIAPVPGISRESRRKKLYSRESTNTVLQEPEKRKNRNRDVNINNPAGIGMASFGLPVIDLKCVESPITDLGDLEEKGIRLVKLRNLKKKRRQSQSSEPDRNGSLNGDTIPEDVKSAVNERLESAEQEITDRTETEKELEPSFVRLALNGADGPETTTYREEEETDRPRRRKSITSSSTRSERSKRNVMEEIGINREPYSTPLLPNLDTNRTDNNSLTQRTSHFLDPQDTGPVRVEVTANENESANVPFLNLPSPGINVVVENLDPTPVLPPAGSGSTTPSAGLSPRSPREDGYVGDSDEPTGTRRSRHRTSSLLSVPASLISECRPPTPPGPLQLQTDAVFEGSEEGGGSGEGSGGGGGGGGGGGDGGGDGGGAENAENEVFVGDVNENSKTIATQTLLVQSTEEKGE